MKNYSLCILGLILFSCSYRVENENIESINFSNPQLVDDDIEDWIQIENNIPLYIPDSITLGKVTQIEFSDSEIFVLEDGINSSILVFDRKGMFQKQLSRLGTGPGEYSQIDFFVLMENSILVYDRSYQKLITYSRLDFSIVEEFKSANYLMGGFGGLFEDRIFLVSDTELEENIYMGYGFYNSDLSQIKLKPQFSGYIEGYLPQSISCFDQLTYLVQPFSEKVYQISSDSLVLSHYIDFGKNKIPEKASEIIQADEFYEILANGSYYFAAHNLLKRKDKIAFGFYNESIDNLNLALIQNGEAFRFIINSRLKELFLKPLTVREGMFQTVLLPGEFGDEVSSILNLTEINYENPILVSYFIGK